MKQYAGDKVRLDIAIQNNSPIRLKFDIDSNSLI